MDMLHLTCLDLKFPSLKAKSEGEKLASALAREELVKAVWSNDTDNYPLGTPLLITGFSGFQQVNVVSLAGLIEGYSKYCGWEFNQSSLVDLCIMHGTDFNPNMPNIGGKRSLDLIKKYGNIDAIAKHEPTKPIHLLNHIRSRQIFEYEASGFNDKSVELDYSASTIEMFAKHGCSDLFGTVSNSLFRINRIAKPEPKVLNFASAAPISCEPSGWKL